MDWIIVIRLALALVIFIVGVVLGWRLFRIGSRTPPTYLDAFNSLPPEDKAKIIASLIQHENDD